MTPESKSIWSGLEFRKPMLLRNVEPLSEEQMRWKPAPHRNSIAWQLWHIAEVEDNWVRLLITDEPLHLPFGVQMRHATEEQFPTQPQLLDYFAEVRAVTRGRLEAMNETDFDREVEDADFGRLTVRDAWAG
ncbi:MAG: DinB family protein, partial [Planctomycetota bacterium]